MADDVKVKFGGDFTDVPKGAEAAATAAGTAMQGWVGKYANSLKDKLASAFSLENIVSKFVSSASAQLEKFKEIDTLSRKLGVSREELQKFSKIGKEFNLDMETMGRSIAFANKTLGASAMGNKEAQSKLLQLGYTQEQVNSGNIKATDVLFKLAESYEKNKKLFGETVAQNLLAKQTTDLFGRAGSDLVSIIKEGNVELKKRIELMGVYTESEVKAGAAADRAIERIEAKLQKNVIGKILMGLAALYESFEVFGVGGEGGIMEDALKRSGFKSRSDVKTQEDIDKLSKNFMEAGKEAGYDPEDLIRISQAHKMTSVGLSSKNEELLNKMMINLENSAREQRNEEKKRASEAPVSGSGANTGMGENGPSSGVIGFGNTAQLLLMSDQLDVLKQINDKLDNSQGAKKAPDFTKPTAVEVDNSRPDWGSIYD
jgi:hypothetical protein